MYFKYQKQELWVFSFSMKYRLYQIYILCKHQWGDNCDFCIKTCHILWNDHGSDKCREELEVQYLSKRTWLLSTTQIETTLQSLKAALNFLDYILNHQRSGKTEIQIFQWVTPAELLQNIKHVERKFLSNK